jgi:hypothetical protein
MEFIDLPQGFKADRKVNEFAIAGAIVFLNRVKVSCYMINIHLNCPFCSFFIFLNAYASRAIFLVQNRRTTRVGWQELLRQQQQQGSEAP